LRQLKRLRQPAPILVALPPAHGKDRLFLVEQVCALADYLYVTEFSPPLVYQPALI
jgi:hypothetical protein